VTAFEPEAHFSSADEIRVLAQRAVDEGFPLTASPWPKTDLEKSKAGGPGWNTGAQVFTDLDVCFGFLTQTLPTHNALVVPGSLHPTNTRHDLVIIECDGAEDLAIAEELGFVPHDTYTVRSSAPDRLHLYYRTEDGFRPERPCVRIEAGKITQGTRRIYVSELSYHAKTGQAYRALDPEKPLLRITAERLASIERAVEAQKPSRKRPKSKKTGASGMENGIPEGRRHDALLKYTWALLHDGYSEQDVLAKALIYNAERCDPPKDDHLVEELVHYTFAKHTLEDTATDDGGWRTPIDLASLDERDPLQPDLAPSYGTVYPGKRHLFSGRPESLKTLLTYGMVLDAVRAGHEVAILNFEMDPYDARDLFRDLGAADNELRAIRFYSPESAPAEADITALVSSGIALLIIDAGAGMYQLEEADDNKRLDVERVTKKWIDPAHRASIATVVIDHSAKKGVDGWAIGSERKVGVSDVHLRLEIKGAPLIRGGSAVVRVTVEKDRKGRIRREAPEGLDVRVTSDPATEALALDVIPATGGTEDGFRPTALMERVSMYVEEHPGIGKTEAADLLGKRKQYVLMAIQSLFEGGYLRIERGKNGKQCLYHEKPYRQATDDGQLIPPASEAGP
jgi:hypothetical protein